MPSTIRPHRIFALAALIPVLFAGDCKKEPDPLETTETVTEEAQSIALKLQVVSIDPSTVEPNKEFAGTVYGSAFSQGARVTVGGKEATGVVVPFTLGYQTTWDNDALPRRYEIGGWYDGADYTDPVFDEQGNYAALSGNDYAVRNGRSGVFARFEQTVTRPNPSTKKGLTLFGAVLTGTSGELIEDYYLKAGFVMRGTLASRPNDTIGFVFTRQQYTDEALEDQRILRAMNGGVGTPPSSQTMLELSYGYQLNQHVRIQPNVHYIINPDQFAERDRVSELDDAIVLGLRFDVNLAGLLIQ